MSHRTLPTVVDRKLLTELLVDVSVGEQVRTRTPGTAPGCLGAGAASLVANVSQLVRDALPALHGDEGRLLSWVSATLKHGCASSSRTAPSSPWRRPSCPSKRGVRCGRRPPSSTRDGPTDPRRAAARLAEETLTVLGDAGTELLLAGRSNRA
jgi:hypothetical protein